MLSYGYHHCLSIDIERQLNLSAHKNTQENRHDTYHRYRQSLAQMPPQEDPHGMRGFFCCPGKQKAVRGMEGEPRCETKIRASGECQLIRSPGKHSTEYIASAISTLRITPAIENYEATTKQGRKQKSWRGYSIKRRPENEQSRNHKEYRSH